MNKHTSTCILLLILLLGLFLRVHQLEEPSVWIDEAFSRYATLNIIAKGSPIMESGISYSNYKGYHYPLAWYSKVTSTSIAGMRSYSVILGVLTILLGYMLGKEFFASKKIGLLTALLIACSTWEIAWSRQIRSYQQLQLLYVTTLFLLQRYISKPNNYRAVAVLAGAIMTILTHEFGYALIAVIGVVLSSNILNKTSPLGQKVRFGIHVLKNSAARKRQIKQLNKKPTKTISSILLSASILFLVLVKAKSLLTQVSMNSQTNAQILITGYNSFLQSEHKIVIVTAILGAIVTLYNWNKTSTLIAGISIPYLLIILFVPLFHYRYLFFVFPIVLLFTAALIRQILAIQLKKYTTIVQGVLLTVVLIAIFSQGFTIKPQTVTLEPQTPQPDFKAAHNHIATHLQEGDVLIVGNTVPARIYNNTPNYWLRYSLTGKTTTATTDRFTGIPAIYEPEQLKQIESTTTGTVWIVIDQLAATRIPKEMYTTIQEEYEINWSKRNNAWSAIWIAKSK